MYRLRSSHEEEVDTMISIRHILKASVGALLPCLTLCTALTGCAVEEREDLLVESPDAIGQTCAAATSFTFKTAGDKTIAYLGSQPVAWFTTGAYTVLMTGPSRTFTSGSPATVTVNSTSWVRTMAQPFTGSMSKSSMTSWLNAARAVNCAAPTGTPDILAIAFEYAEGASDDAGYDYGADFHDYLGVSWLPLDGTLKLADPLEKGKLDCSGYMRLVWGHRTNFVYNLTSSKIPLSFNAYSNALPRESEDIYENGPGKLVVPFRVAPAGASASNGGAPTAAELAALQVGDLVFFDGDCDYSVANPSCGTSASAITHVGTYVGTDTGGRYRFISSRASADGPTIGNGSGWSVFDMNPTSTFYPKRFRAARRL
jgi:cell wall-associated NlpC family hydrolase